MLQLRALADGVTRFYDGQRGSLLGGQRMLICFGYPQAYEDNARRAVRAALELVEQVARFLEAVRGRGIPILLVEQKLAIALDISERVYVLGHGRVVFEGTPAQLREAHDVRKEWLEV